MYSFTGVQILFTVTGFTGPKSPNLPRTPGDKIKPHDPLRLEAFFSCDPLSDCCCFQGNKRSLYLCLGWVDAVVPVQPDISFLPLTRVSMIVSDSSLAFNKDSMCCVAAAKDFTNAGWREVTALYISHRHWQLTDGYHSHTEKEPPGRFPSILSVRRATFDGVPLRIINPHRSTAEPSSSAQCPGFFVAFFFPLKHEQTYTSKLCFVH